MMHSQLSLSSLNSIEDLKINPEKSTRCSNFCGKPQQYAVAKLSFLLIAAQTHFGGVREAQVKAFFESWDAASPSPVGHRG
jgi:hypothetical protein